MRASTRFERMATLSGSTAPCLIGAMARGGDGRSIVLAGCGRASCEATAGQLDKPPAVMQQQQACADVLLGAGPVSMTVSGVVWRPACIPRVACTSCVAYDCLGKPSGGVLLSFGVEALQAESVASVMPPARTPYVFLSC